MVEPGVFLGMPMEEYLAMDAVSASDLWKLASTSPAHFRAYHFQKARGEVDTNPAMSFGTALHTLVLEPGEFGKRYTQAGECMATKKDGDLCGNPSKVWRGGVGYCGVRGHDPAPGEPTERELIPDAEWHRLHTAAEYVNGHPRLRRILNGKGDAEVTLVWRDPGTGLMCKARPDFLSGEYRLILDLKTVGRSAHPANLGREVWQWGYHFKAAHYLQGAEVLEWGADAFLFAFVESAGPYHGVTLAELSTEDLEAGWVQHRDAMDLYSRCLNSDEWPGYPDTVQVIRLPAYARRIMEETDE